MTYYLVCAAIFVVTYLLNMTYITVFYHRGLTHQAVILNPTLRRFVIATGNWVTGLDPKGWSCMHRMHHLYSDTAKDPHSPSNVGIFGVMLAQLNSYNAILRRLKRQNKEFQQIVPDLDFPINWLNLHKLWFLPYVIHLSVWLLLGYTTGMWLLGYAYFLGMMSHPVQGWLVNAFGHAKGYRNFD